MVINYNMSTHDGIQKVDNYSKDNNWIYAGGDNKHHLNYWNIFYTSKNWSGKTPKKKKKCVCNHIIERNCWIYNKKTKQMKVIGACCIEKFNLGGRTCAICGDEHNNRKNNYCNNCRKGICDDCYKPLKNTNYKICYHCNKKRSNNYSSF